MADAKTTLAQWPAVTIAVPALNEERYIAGCLSALLKQDYPGSFEILVVDGGSLDQTGDIVAGFCSADPRVRLLLNTDRLQSAACNLAAREASPRASVLLRCDAHCGYPDDFIKNCVVALLDHCATSVVVPMVAAGKGRIQSAIAALQNSWIGNGGAAHHRTGRSGFVDHGHHAAFDLTFFRRVSGYDPEFSHNEDAELDHRMSLIGGRIWMAGGNPVTYFPRATIPALARQYSNHGRGRARMLLKHQVRPRLRQMAPLFFLACSAAGVVLAPWAPWSLALPIGYFLASTAAGLRVLTKARQPPLASVGALVMSIHLSWAVGFISGFVRHPRVQWAAKPQEDVLARPQEAAV